jgi:hypothetical protein
VRVETVPSASIKRRIEASVRGLLAVELLVKTIVRENWILTLNVRLAKYCVLLVVSGWSKMQVGSRSNLIVWLTLWPRSVPHRRCLDWL